MMQVKKDKGYFLIQTLVFGMIAVVVITGLVAFAGANSRLGRRSVLSEQAFETAEAGLEYYRWHLAHAPSDFTNGTGAPGPYVKNLYDKNGTLLGTYTLTITPPPLGSTIVIIQSVGQSAIDPSVKRTLLEKLNIPSFANYAAITNSAMRFGQGTEVFGPIHSNDGIHFDGIAHNLVTSALSNYKDPDHSGSNEFGVHTHVIAPPGVGVNNAFRSSEAPPNPVPDRSDVFMAGRSFPAPIVDFSVITTNLAQSKTDAQSNGKYFAASGVKGYKIVFKTNDTFDIYKVNTLIATPNGCPADGTQDGWGTWSISSATLVANYPNPTNGIIFVEDDVWVEGQINSARVTVVAAQLPDVAAQRKSITINNNLLYTNYDGTDVIALIAQKNINVGMISADNLKIDAALVADNGRVGRYYYAAGCSPYDTRASLTLYGTLVTALRYGFAYTDGTGYTTRTLTYDAFLLYNPPPSFPQTSPYYQIIYWKEI